ncbi:MAG: nucleotidyl transferase AbiEii/AbiGii toxin family protein [Prevotellaceae bacterium]|jgi:predicted nucleotidyltransferase component of viral defense system|nr:nucleotidyl transferase AbiEii/AbiGii toxin family protein [Prevotellaceae bacterium]
MNDLFTLSNSDKLFIIKTAADKVRLPAQIIEKDLWVTTILQIIFSLPVADKLVFKGGTSLSKAWKLITRFSEDIDLAIAREQLGLPEGDLTVKQIKKLRKQSSLFVKETFCNELQNAVNQYNITDICTITPQPDGEGDKTYPEPRKIHIQYKSLFAELPYIKSEVTLEIGARSLFEPTAKVNIKSIISEQYPVYTAPVQPEIITAAPQKTFLEKAFLLHEIFTSGGNMHANRKSRHLYDLERMMGCDFAVKAVADNELWETIRHHREVFTRVNGVDYTPDIRKRIVLIPPKQAIAEWQQDYETMRNSMIYGDSLAFDELLKRIEELQERFRKQNDAAATRS